MSTPSKVEKLDFDSQQNPKLDYFKPPVKESQSTRASSEKKATATKEDNNYGCEIIDDDEKHNNRKIVIEEIDIDINDREPGFSSAD